MKELQYKQINEEEVDTMLGNTADAKKHGVDGYYLPKHEKDMIHAEMEIKEFSAASGKKLSKPYIQKFNVRNFNEAMKNNFYAGYSITILHDPRTESEKKAVKAQTSDGGGQVGGIGSGAAKTKTDVPEWYKTNQWKSENKESIIEKYVEVVGSEPDSSMTKAQLIEFIESEIDD